MPRRDSTETLGLVVIKHAIEHNPHADFIGQFPTHVVETKHEIGGGESVATVTTAMRLLALQYRSGRVDTPADIAELLFLLADRVEQIEETAGELLARLGLDEGDKVEIRFPTVAEDCVRLAVAIDAAMPDPSLCTYDGPMPEVVRDAEGNPAPFESFPSLNRETPWPDYRDERTASR